MKGAQGEGFGRDRIGMMMMMMIPPFWVYGHGDKIMLVGPFKEKAGCKQSTGSLQ